MVIKDRIVKWFIENIVIPRQEIIDKPGFIVTQFSDKGKQVFLREIFFPERLFSDLEKEILVKYGDKGRRQLYSAGKVFGYNYCRISYFPTAPTTSKSEFERFIYMFVRYAESMWSKELKYDIDLENRTFEMSADRFIVCRLNGLGHLITEGIIAGFWAYVMADKSIEGVQASCQGRGEDACRLFCAPPKLLEEKRLSFCKETDLEARFDAATYSKLNQISAPERIASSFYDLLNSGFFTYFKGEVRCFDERHFLCEASLFYLLEKMLFKIKNADEIIFDAAFEFGKRLASYDKISEKFVSDYMSAVGWGEVLVFFRSNKYAVVSNHFPWTEYSNDASFSIFRGIVSGILSSLGRKVLLKRCHVNMSQGFMQLTVTES